MVAAVRVPDQSFDTAAQSLQCASGSPVKADVRRHSQTPCHPSYP
jgi:hypothetical protein